MIDRNLRARPRAAAARSLVLRLGILLWGLALPVQATAADAGGDLAAPVATTPAPLSEGPPCDNYRVPSGTEVRLDYGRLTAGRPTRFTTGLLPAAGAATVRIEEPWTENKVRYYPFYRPSINFELDPNAGRMIRSLYGVSVAPGPPLGDGDKKSTLLTFTVPNLPWLIPTKLDFQIVACGVGLEDKPPVFAIKISAWVVSPLFGWLGATLLIGLCYVGMVRFLREPDGRLPWNPVVLTQGSDGRASLSRLQMLFFTVLVAWLLAIATLRTGILVDLSPDLLYLIGIAGFGNLSAKVTATLSERLAAENWVWLKRKGWFQQIRRDTPSARQLITTDGEFDIYRFQMLVFSLIVGVTLMLNGFADLSSYSIPPALFGVLGMSQTIYVVGRVATPNAFASLDKLLTQLREQERAWLEAVSADSAWSGASERSLETARRLAPQSYLRYRELAESVAVLFDETLRPGFRGLPEFPVLLEPALPT